jgi:hypothetical protein
LIYCVVTADSPELASGELDSFLNSIRPAKIRVVLVLRDVAATERTRYASDSAVWQVLDSPPAGLSTVRNLGLKYLAGKLADSDIVSFPDDDCQYPTGLVDSVIQTMENDGIDMLVGRYGEHPVPDASRRRLSLHDALFRSSSVCMFIRWSVVRQVGGFNESLGVGSGNFGYGEDNDFALRARARAANAVIDSSFHVWHLEVRPTVGRNPKGYLVPALLNIGQPILGLYIVRGVVSALYDDIRSLPKSPAALRAVAAALAPTRLRRAWIGRKQAQHIFDPLDPTHPPEISSDQFQV